MKKVLKRLGIVMVCGAMLTTMMAGCCLLYTSDAADE